MAPALPPTCPQPDQAPGEFAKLLDEAQAPDVAVTAAADDEALNEEAVAADPALAVPARDAVVDPAALLANLAAAQYTAAPNHAAQRTTAEAPVECAVQNKTTAGNDKTTLGNRAPAPSAAVTAALAAQATQAAQARDSGGAERHTEAQPARIDALPEATPQAPWIKLPAATPAAAPAAEGRLSATPGSAEFAPQLAAQLSTFVREGVHHARLELNPAEMGPLTVQIQIDGDRAQVHLAAENAHTRQALEQSMPQLAGGLREAGLTLSGGGVFEQPRQPQARRGARFTGAADSADAAVSATLAAAPTLQMAQRRGVVDLMA